MGVTENKLLAILSLLLTACTTPTQHKMALVHEGMTRQELVNLLGPPTSSTSQGALSVLIYDFAQRSPAALHPRELPKTSYYVIVGREGEVRSFGPN